MRRVVLLLVVVAGLCGMLLSSLPRVEARGAVVSGASAQTNDARASAAFEAMAPVMRHPRCMNCHMTGDYPRQGDDSHPHIMRVQRGPDGNGVAPVRCSTCHQDHNLAGLHAPPGAPDWGLPPPAMPMIWEGKTDRELCELLKDPNRNGHMSMAQMVHHMETPLVRWGWHPGEGRTPIPGSEEGFERDVKVWVESGGACPAR